MVRVWFSPQGSPHRKFNFAQTQIRSFMLQLFEILATRLCGRKPIRHHGYPRLRAPPYTPEVSPLPNPMPSTIEQVEAAHRATRLQRYLLEIIAHSLEVDISKIAKAVPFEWPTYDGFRASLLQKREQAHLLRLSKTIAYMHRQIATSTLENGRMILLDVVEPSRTLKIDPGFTLELMATYANEHFKSWKHKRKHNLIADLTNSQNALERSSRTWLYLNVISQLVLQLSPNDVMQKTLRFALEKYHRGRHQELGFIPVFSPRDTNYRGYSNLAEFLSSIPIVGENGTWQQLFALVPCERSHCTMGFSMKFDTQVHSYYILSQGVSAPQSDLQTPFPLLSLGHHRTPPKNTTALCDITHRRRNQGQVQGDSHLPTGGVLSMKSRRGEEALRIIQYHIR